MLEVKSNELCFSSLEKTLQDASRSTTLHVDLHYLNHFYRAAQRERGKERERQRRPVRVKHGQNRRIKTRKLSQKA